MGRESAEAARFLLSPSFLLLLPLLLASSPRPNSSDAFGVNLNPKKEILGILLCFALAAFAMGKRVQIPSHQEALSRPPEGSCQYSAYLNYLWAFAQRENDRQKSFGHWDKAKLISRNCKLDPALLERIEKFRISFP